jgi:hypothetical protein
MIDALVSGRLHKPAVSRVSHNGNRFVTCTVRVPTAARPARLSSPR